MAATDTLKLEIKVQDDGSVVIKNFKGIVSEAFDAVKEKAGQTSTWVEKFWAQIGMGNVMASAFMKGASMIKNGIHGSAEEFMKAEAIHADMVAQMDILGIATAKEISRFDQFAKQVQKQTTVDDEMAKSLVTMAMTMGVAGDKIEQTVQGVIGLSKAYKMDYETAMRGVVQAQQGHFDLLSRSIPALRSAEDETGKMTILQHAMATGYARAQAEIKTTAGQWAQFKNQIADFQEVLGGIMVKGIKLVYELKEAIVILLAALAVNKMSHLKIFEDMSTYFKVLKSEGASTGEAISGAFKTATGTAGGFGKLLKSLPTTLKIGLVIEGMELAVKGLKAIYNEIGYIQERKMQAMIQSAQADKQVMEDFNLIQRAGSEQIKKNWEGIIKNRMDFYKESKYEAILHSKWVLENDAETIRQGLKQEEAKQKELDKNRKENEKKAEEERKAMEKQIELNQKKTEELKKELGARTELMAKTLWAYKEEYEAAGRTLAGVREAALKNFGAIGQFGILFAAALDPIPAKTEKIVESWQEVEAIIGVINGAMGAMDSFAKELGINISAITQPLGNILQGFASIKAGQAGIEKGKTPEGNILDTLGGVASMIGGVGQIASAAIQIGKTLISVFSGDGIGEAIRRENSWMNLTKEQIKQLKELAKQTGDTHTATSMMLAEFIRSGDVTVKNFDQYAGRMHEILADVDRGKMSSSEAAKYIGESWIALTEKMTSLKLPGASKEMIATIQDLKARGIEVKEVSDYVKSELEKGIKALDVYFKTAGESAEKFARAQAYTFAMFEESVAKEGYMDAIEKYGSALDQIDKIASEKGMKIAGALQDALGMRGLMKDEAVKGIYEEIQASTQILSTLGNIGKLNMETFAMAMADVNNQYDRLIASGATEKQALQLSAEELSKLWWYSKQYNLSLDEKTQKLVESAQREGAINAQMIPAQDKMVSLLEKMVTLMGGDIPYAMEKTYGKAVSVIDDLHGRARGLGDQLDYTFRERSGKWNYEGNFRGESNEPPTYAAAGFEGIAWKPQMFIAGERDPERIKIQPIGRGNSGGGDFNVNVIINGSNLSPQDIQKEVVKGIRYNIANIRKEAKDTGW